MKSNALFVILALCHLVGAEQTVERHGISDSLVVVPASRMSKGEVEAIAREYLRQKKGAQILRVTMGSDNNELLASRGTGLADWQGFCFPPAHPTHPMARLIALGGSALISYQPSKVPDIGPAEEWLIGGKSDPTSFNVGQTTYRLLHFWIGGTGGLIDRDDVTFYFQASSQPSVGEAKQLLTVISRFTTAQKVGVEIRTDAFFADDSNFPAFYPFYRGPFGRFVDWPFFADGRSYYRAPEIGCHSDSVKGVLCDQFAARQ